jgi:hypothetical protein
MKNSIAIAVLALGVGLGSMFAQSKVGTTAAQFLLIEPSARETAMGNAGVTSYEDIQSVYYNPAALGHQASDGVQFTHSPWLAGITYDYVGGVMRLGEAGNLFASVTSLNSGDISVTTVNQPTGTGEKYSVTDLAIGLGYGKRISDRFSVGVQATYLQETIWHSSMSGFAVNVGAIYQLSENGFRIGTSISNWGTRPKYDGLDTRVLYDQNATVRGDNNQIPAQIMTDDFPLPVLFRVGVGFPVVFDENNRLQVAVDAFHPSDNAESFSVGGEYLFFKTFALRGGYQNIGLPDSEVGLTLGAGLQYEMNAVRVFFDYAWADYGRLEKTQRLSLGVMF